jgi:type I restriction enzyme, S subunit
MNMNRSTVNSQLPDGYKQTEVGLIPEDWAVIPLGEIGNFKNGINKNSEAFGHGYPFVNLMDVFGVSSISGNNLFDLIETNSTERKTYNLKEGDVLFIRSSVKPSGVGLTALIKEDLDQIVYSGFLIRFRDGGSISKNFKQHCFYEEGFRKRLISASSVSANTNINQDNLKQLLIPLPSTIEEQDAIAHALSDIDALIESLDRLLTKKRQIKQGAMQELLRSKEGWVEKRLSEIAEIRSGGTPSTSRHEFWDGDILWCTPTDITALKGHKYLVNTSRLITIQGLNSSSAEMIPANSVVMTSRATIGECAINRVPVSTNQGFKNLVPHDDIDVEFLYYLLQAQKQKFISLCGGSTFLEIGKNQLSEFLIELPSLSKQIEIATILSDMDAEIDSIEAKLTKTRQIKQGMMHELLTGKIRLI